MYFAYILLFLFRGEPGNFLFPSVHSPLLSLIPKSSPSLRFDSLWFINAEWVAVWPRQLWQFSSISDWFCASVSSSSFILSDVSQLYIRCALFWGVIGTIIVAISSGAELSNRS